MFITFTTRNELMRLDANGFVAVRSVNCLKIRSENVAYDLILAARMVDF